jgi:hypothetical protein
LITQPTGGRRSRNGQRDTVRTDVQDVLSAVDTAELTDRKGAERLRRLRRWIDEGAARNSQKDRRKEQLNNSA